LKLKKIQWISNSSLKLLIKDASEKKCRIRFKAKGSSMKPIIRDKDIITIYPYDSFCPSVGDIAAFIHPVTDKLLIHRIIKKNSTFTIKGDNMFFKDGKVESKNILGFVGSIQRGKKNYRLDSGKTRQSIVWLSRFNIFFIISLFHKAGGMIFALFKIK